MNGKERSFKVTFAFENEYLGDAFTKLLICSSFTLKEVKCYAFVDVMPDVSHIVLLNAFSDLPETNG